MIKVYAVEGVVKKTARRSGERRAGVFEASGRSDHFLQGLQGANLDDVVSRLGLEHHLFAGEGIHAFASRSLRLVLLHDLHETRHGE